MGSSTKIQWCEHTFNPWRGCTKVSEGCANCYADTQSKRNPGVLGVWGPNGTRVLASEEMWKEPLKWNRAAKKEGVRRRVFCASLADVFEDWTGDIHLVNGDIAGREIAGGGMMKVTLDDVRARLFSLICDTPQLDWLLLTKRPQNVRPMLERIGHHGDLPLNIRVGGESSVWDSMPLPNVWIGTSVENQQMADERIPHLLRIPARVRFLSCEPLLGPISFEKPSGICHCGMEMDAHGIYDGHSPLDNFDSYLWHGIDWVIVGGESGKKARLCHLEWVADLVDQCRQTKVPVFVKQIGAAPMVWESSDTQRLILTEDPKGGNPEEWPEVLRVREFPTPEKESKQ